MYQFSSATELLVICQNEGKDIAEIALLAEAEESGKDVGEIWSQMEEYFQLMTKSIQKGLDKNIRSVGGLIGGNAYLLNKRLYEDCLSGTLVLKAASYALAVTEVNACMGKVVAAPTAGASGTLPGVLLALKEERGHDMEKVIGALLTGAAIGKIIASQASLSGAEMGCQAEVGSAAAMSAAAAVYMAGGGEESCLTAAAMALKGMLGLVCDPVAGLVEVPCSKRNAIGVAHAFLCADMALAGIRSFIPFDEMVGAMARVGRMMSPDFKETAQGGCAITATAKDYAVSLQGLS